MGRFASAIEIKLKPSDKAFFRFHEIKMMLLAYDTGRISEQILAVALHEYAVIQSYALMIPTCEGCISIARLINQ